MKSLFIDVVIPLLVAIAFVFILNDRLVKDEYFVNDFVDSSNYVLPEHIPSFDQNATLESVYRLSSIDTSLILLLGSSELFAHSEYIPYKFVHTYFPKRVIGIGHEGNQCFSIFCQLLANYEYLHDAQIVIILSPGWFEDKPSRGTSSEKFLEFNSGSYVERIINSVANEELKNYAFDGIHRFYPELNAPTAPYRIASLNSVANQSIFHKVLCYLPNHWNKLLMKKGKLFSINQSSNKLNVNVIKAFKTQEIHWDSLAEITRQSALSACTNNDLGIEDSYYTTYINGKHGKIRPVNLINNREFNDFKMLIELLKFSGAKASFVISPLNVLYYHNITLIDPVIDSIQSTITQNGFPCLRLFNSDKRSYQKALLTDVMHMSSYGWLQVDQFIIENYSIQP